MKIKSRERYDIREIKISHMSSAVLLLLEILLVVITVIMIKMEYSASWNINCECLTSMYSLFEELLVKDNSHIMDGFCLLWGMTMTVVLFLIESGNTYWYGMRFKRIIEITISKPVLLIGALEYFLLCPVTYMLETAGLYKACLWCIGLTVLAFAAVPCYAIAVTQKKRINRLILIGSIKGYRKIIKDQEDRYIEMALLQLPISSMILNTSYEDAREVECLIETIRKNFRRKKRNFNIYISFAGYIHIITWIDWVMRWLLLQMPPFFAKKINLITPDTFLDYVIVMTWADLIVEQSGFSSEQEKERTTYILKRLWEIIEKELRDLESNEDKRYYKRFSYAIEILLPLFCRESEATDMIFASVWNSMREIRFKVLPYLLLYAEFCHRDCQQKFFEKYCCIMGIIENNKEDFREACVLWSGQEARRIAKEFWLAWTAYRDGSNDIGITTLLAFYDDIEMISGNNIAAVKTYIMKRIRNILK